jgi:hypothetical protein
MSKPHSCDRRHISEEATPLLSASRKGDRARDDDTEWRRAMRQGETFLSGGSDASLFLIGRNSRGNWVPQDQRGRRGGLFVNRAAALKYALFENGNQPHLVVTIPGNFDLDLSGNIFQVPAPQADVRVQALAA